MHKSVQTLMLSYHFLCCYEPHVYRPRKVLSRLSIHPTIKFRGRVYLFLNRQDFHQMWGFHRF